MLYVQHDTIHTATVNKNLFAKFNAKSTTRSVYV